MKKIIGIFSAFLLPIVSFAHGYNHMMNGDYASWEGNSMMLLAPLFALAFVPIIGFIIAILGFILWVYMLVDAIKHSPEKTKIVWVLVIIFTHIIGALIYYFVEKRPRSNTEHKAN